MSDQHCKFVLDNVFNNISNIKFKKINSRVCLNVPPTIAICSSCDYECNNTVELHVLITLLRGCKGYTLLRSFMLYVYSYSYDIVHVMMYSSIQLFLLQTVEFF